MIHAFGQVNVFGDDGKRAYMIHVVFQLCKTLPFTPVKFLIYQLPGVCGMVWFTPYSQTLKLQISNFQRKNLFLEHLHFI